MTSCKLPNQFSDLKPYSAWVLETETARNRKRLASTMDDLRQFYAAMLPRVEDALRYLDNFPLHEMPEAEQNLLHLTLSLAEVADAVELFKTEPGVIDGFPVERFIRMHDQKPIHDTRAEATS